MAKFSYSLHPIKLKLHVQLDHDVEQCILFRGYSPPNSRVKPLRKCLLIFCFQLNPPTVYIRSGWNLICSKTMMWSSAYCFKVTVHQILAELTPLKISINFFFSAKSSYSLHPIKLKLHKYLHDDVEQRILFLGYSAPNICRFMPLWKFL